MTDEFLFAEDNEEVVVEELGTWKVLVVDDEPEVHAVTKLALSDFVFQDKRLQFISAYNGEEARKIFETHDDIAVVLLDVVMETDDAGLKVAEYVRNTLNNHFTRIILRTGQPGQAPERDVILNYDINDYKSKTELTAQKLFTVIIASLRSYRDIIVIEENRQGLEKIIKASADLFSKRSLEGFIEGIMQQLTSLLGGTKDAAYITSAVAGPDPIEASHSRDFFVFTGKGDFEHAEGKPLEQALSGGALSACKKALQQQALVYEDEYIVAYCQGKSLHGSLLYLSGLPRQLTQTDKYLIELFSQNVQVAFDNVLLTRDIEITQREILERLARAVESQFAEGHHLERMVYMCELLGREYGLDDKEIETLKLAVPLHDIGKLKVPEEILNKHGRLSDSERDVIKNHAQCGYTLLKGSKRPIIQAAAIVARDHHEYWDGSGYPRGLKGEEIHVFCRITAVADVYDALRCGQPYKEPWPVEKVIEVFKSERGKQFEPKLVDILLDNIERIEEIQSTFQEVT
ncbi:DUF3369 domain-containing protein [Aestuariibacter sp. AA17]|uniref:DUF3369 domain-containing protein n=1 Tax=Fluctibacter corallii TaxID=2984329 RepID=A0ABT3ADE5_9ALTE|nr:DUF3369 domain-containing protein [Aestuariibacter sp. AA17]MCV2886663.1 DUF3369 domain-containing protein [Aestuariibacter sp. AA17]